MSMKEKELKDYSDIELAEYVAEWVLGNMHEEIYDNVKVVIDVLKEEGDIDISPTKQSQISQLVYDLINKNFI